MFSLHNVFVFGKISTIPLFFLEETAPQSGGTDRFHNIYYVHFDLITSSLTTPKNAPFIYK